MSIFRSVTNTLYYYWNNLSTFLVYFTGPQHGDLILLILDEDLEKEAEEIRISLDDSN
jgi:hypothetical protein